MSNHEIAAFALAVHVRNAALEAVGVESTLGDGFPLEDWRELYERCRECAAAYEQSYPDPEERVHQIQGRIAS